jgi:DNA-binding protein HU-beta
MNKSELIAVLAAKSEMPATKVKLVIDAFVETVTERMVAREEVAISDLGIFKTKDRAERQGRNPQTGDPMTIAATTVASFQVSAALKRAVK